MKALYLEGTSKEIASVIRNLYGTDLKPHSAFSGNLAIMRKQYLSSRKSTRDTSEVSHPSPMSSVGSETSEETNKAGW